MNEFPRTVRSVCPHDCPSTCALDIEILSNGKMGRVRGAKDDPYTAGVICEKVARYAERYHHPERLLHPLRRVGAKGAGNWERISWDEALDEIATRFLEVENRSGSEAVWPYYYAGTMGHVNRDGINKLRHAKNYSGQYNTICSHVAWGGYLAGTGRVTGVNPVHMVEADNVVIWGTNPVHTQVNVMTHAMRARKNGAKIAVVDIYETATMQQADFPILLRPGSDGAFAVAIMHVLLRDGLADRAYLAKYTDFSQDIEDHLAQRSPEWAEKITGLDAKTIEAFAHFVGEKPNTYFRLGYGFTRQRNGITNMHAALCIPAMTGAWQHQGGGAFHSHSGAWQLDKTELEGTNLANPKTRLLDMSRVGPILTGDKDALRGGPAIEAMLVQNMNPVVTVPNQTLVRQGLLRSDLFLVVHEQFMTETAALADIVLPAAMFTEHADYYTRGGHSRIMVGPKVMEPMGECWSNHQLMRELSARLGCDVDLFAKSDNAQIEQTFQASAFVEEGEKLPAFVERSLPRKEAAFLDGFGWPDGRFRFKPNWEDVRQKAGYTWEYDQNIMPKFVDYFDVNEKNDDQHPFRLATSPARAFLNSSFSETPGSQKREKTPRAFLRSDEAATLGILHGQLIQIGNKRGQVTVIAHFFEGLPDRTIIVESLHRNDEHKDNQGINTLIGDDPIIPFGGAAFHDAAVWVRPEVN